MKIIFVSVALIFLMFEEVRAGGDVVLPRCQQPLDVGSLPCAATGGDRFYYKGDGTCKKFDYTGCGGNDNRFSSALSCLMACT